LKINSKALSKFITPFGVLILLLCIFSNQNNAQTASTPNGNFEVNEVVGCAPFTVTPTNLLGGGGSIQYNYDNTLNPGDCTGNYQADPFSCTNGSYTNAIDFTYTTPGDYYLVQLNGNAPDGNKVSYIKITVIEAIEPTYDVFACANNEVFLDIDFTQDSYDSYSIDFGDGSSIQTIDKATDSNELAYTYAMAGDYDITVQGLASGNPTNCSTSTKTISTLDSSPTPVINSLEVMDATMFEVNYESLDSRIVHTLMIESEDGSQFDVITLDPSTNATNYTYTNSNFDFVNTVYSVKIESADRCNANTISSETIYSIASEYTAAYVSSDIQVDFDFNTSASGLDQIQFYEGGSSQETFSINTGSAQRTLSNCTLVDSYYFQASFGAAISTSAPINPDLNGTLSPPAIQNMDGELVNATFELDFDHAPVNATSYTIFKKNPDNTFSPIGTSTTPDFIDSNLRSGQLELCYTVAYEDECGNISEMSSEFCFALSVGTIRLPNAFTPNGDGVNDTFTVGDGVFINFRMQIFDRWGSLIFNSTNPSIGWDGNYNGAPASIGGYAYRISFQDAGNTTIQQTGTLVLIR
tara:strand:- start:18041 stop:19786 length:1746 start_codon:yes stop_codon:yes gene_type:complete